MSILTSARGIYSLGKGLNLCRQTENYHFI